MESDQIAEYLDQLRSSLLTSRRRAQLILDEAEDHLRESAAAGVAAGLTEAEAQRAAIARFGSGRGGGGGAAGGRGPGKGGRGGRRAPASVRCGRSSARTPPRVTAPPSPP